MQVSVTGLTVEEGDPPVDGRQVQRGGRRVGEFRGEAVGRGTGDRGGVLRDFRRQRERRRHSRHGLHRGQRNAGTFASKETSKTVAVTTTEDAFNEADETFTVTLTGVTLPEGVSLDEDATTATGTIENDDGLTATVTANAENVPEGNAAEFTVELDRRHQHRGRHSELHVGGQHGHGRHRLHRTERPADDHDSPIRAAPSRSPSRPTMSWIPARRCPSP